MGDELIDICDENNKLTGMQMMKSAAHADGTWHRVAHIWAYNSKKEILLQLRAKNKDLYPHVWDVSVGGHVSAGEEPIISALRESEEEIGIRAKAEDLQFYRIRQVEIKTPSMINNEFQYIFFMPFHGDPSKLKLQEEEVEKVEFKTLDEALKEPDMLPNHDPIHKGYWAEIVDYFRNE